MMEGSAGEGEEREGEEEGSLCTWKVTIRKGSEEWRWWSPGEEKMVQIWEVKEEEEE